MKKTSSGLAAACASLLALSPVFAAGASRMIADMETAPAFTLAGRGARPIVSIVDKTASQGKKSLRFEYAGGAKDQCMIAFPVEGVGDCDTLAFDIFCETDNGAKVVIAMPLESKDGKTGRFRGTTTLAPYVDGWTPVRLTDRSGLKFAGDVKPDWGQIRKVEFFLDGDMAGKAVFYLDNLRFEKLGEGAKNLIYNSSFEIATNPDTPDGWTRDLNLPPYGPMVWAVDASTAFHGKNSLRIGVAGKYARSWARHTRVNTGEEYTFSAYLKADRPGVRAELAVDGVGSRVVEVGTEWARASFTGAASRPDTAAYVWLKSEGALWVDAAQLEAGAEPSAYCPSAEDATAAQQATSKVRRLSPENMAELKRPVVALRKAQQPPAIDGDLGDACWREAEAMTPFVDLNRNQTASPQTLARMTFDDRAIYIAARADEPDTPAVAKLLDSLRRPPWGGDHIEVSIDLSHDRATYYHFVMDARGRRWQARHGASPAAEDSAWTCEWRSAGKIDASGWTVEAEIPYACFDLGPSVKVGSTLGVNICRDSPRAKSASSWSHAFGAFHTPEAFGDATGFDPRLEPRRLAVAPPLWARGAASVVLEAGAAAAGPCEVTFRAAGDGFERQARAQARCAAGEPVLVHAPLPIEQDGVYELTAVVSGPQGVVAASQPSRFRVSGQSLLDFQGTEFDFYTDDAEARVRCVVDASVERCRRFELRWRLLPGGKEGGPSAALTPVPGLNVWRLALAGLPEGAHTLRAQLLEDGKTVGEATRTFRKLAPAKHEVRVNRWGRFLVVDRRPFFPYGYFNNSERTPEAAWAQALDLMKGAGCNTLLDYVGQSRAAYDRIGWMLDQAAARDMKMWVHLGWMLNYWIPKYDGFRGRYATRDEAMEHLREVVLRHKDHPALLGWCTLDEPGNRPDTFTREYCEAAYRRVKELDPHHPCIFSHLTRLSDFEAYAGATDLVLAPFGGRGASGEALLWRAWRTGMPLMVNRPCFGALAEACREPTPQEARVAMYGAMILGARGLVSYTFRGASERTWEAFGAVAAEVHALQPALLGDMPPTAVDVEPAGADVRAMARIQGDRGWLLAVNTGREAREVCFSLAAAPPILSVRPLFGAPAARTWKGAGRITTAMPPLTTAAYEFVVEPR